MRKSTRSRLNRVYRRLFSMFGPQGWWPAKTPFEVTIGAILTQSTSWSNVEKAIANLKREGVLSPEGLMEIRVGKMAKLITPSLYYNTKARKLKEFIRFFYGEYGGSMESMRKEDAATLRPKLLSVWGLGPETVDSILLYALDKPSFVVDAYTRRLFGRLGFLKGEESYDEIKGMFESNLPKDVSLYKEYHALIVEHCKRSCLKKPKCGECALENGCRAYYH